MIGSRAFWALMRRNVIYRKRNWIGTILELTLPLAFLGILVAIKNATGDTSPTVVEAQFPSYGVTPFSFTDYLTAMQAQRVCIPNGVTSSGKPKFRITGLQVDSYAWMVPFVKCDSRNCQQAGDATPFCEYAKIAVSGASTADTGGQARAQEFKDWLYQQYPILLDSTAVHHEGFDFVHVMNSPQEMDDYVRRGDYGNSGVPKIGMGIVFDGNDPNQFKYWLRQNVTNFNGPEQEGRPATLTSPNTARLFDSFAKKEEDVCQTIDGTADLGGELGLSCTGQYMYNGILTMQRLVGDFIIDRAGAKAVGAYVAENGVSFVPFPTRPYEEAGFFGDIGSLIGLIVMIGLLWPVAAMTLYVTREKEARQKELMKMMSVNESDLGWSWFLTFYLFNILTALLCTAVSTKIYTESEPLWLLIFWLFTFLSITIYSMLIGAINSKPVRGTMIGLLVFFLGAFLPLAVAYDTGDSGTLGLLSLHPVCAFTYGLQQVGDLEDKGVGLTRNTIDSTDNPSDYTFVNTIQYQIISILLMGFFTWYLNRVIRPDYGQALPLWFPFSMSYWCPRRGHAPEEEVKVEEELDDSVPIEPVSDALKRQAGEGRSIEIRGLKKQFGDKVAVDGLTLSMYSGEITALLGHNGAGKTTTINMLTGAMAPSAGTAMVAGKDIRTQLQAIRQDIGICLQHDCLFPNLTVREHIQFFSRLKGLYSTMSRREAEEHIDQVIQDVALSEKRNTFSKNLSGGMKRKLSVAMAFCGGSKVVLLDEPTSGMDPFSRRFTWNVIRQFRQDRCIILTTHFMDEADILGDRIAIMAEGRLRCAGSSLFLKKTYGVGYQLTIEKRQSSGASLHGARAEADVDDSNDDKLKEIVTSNVEDANLLTNVGSEIIFQLPMTASDRFPAMFQGLDDEVESGAITSYGVSITTLDEVFLLVARGNPSESKKFASSVRNIGNGAAADDEKSARSRMDLEKEGLYLRHVGALFKKRAAIFKRDRVAWCCTMFLPSVIVLLGFIIFNIVANSRDRTLEPRLMTLNDYNPSVSGVRNPITYNSPESFYDCNPTYCSYSGADVFVQETGEQYYYCGYQATRNIDQACSVNSTSIIATEVREAGAYTMQADVSSVLESSVHLYNTSNEFDASQYGALFYTHSPISVLENGTSYNSTVVAECIANNGNYTSVDNCVNFAGIGYLVQYNFTALHVAPLFQSLGDEALVRDAIGNPDFKIDFTIAALTITNKEEKYGAADDATFAWLLMVLSFPFITGAFATFIVLERESKAKHLQTVAGVKPVSYWMSTWLWDVLNYQIPLWITVLLMFVFSVGVLTTTDGGVVYGIIVVLFLYGPASAGLAYCISFAFSSASICNIAIIISGFLIGIGGPLTVFILDLIGQDPGNPKPNLVNVANILRWLLRFLPQFCLGNGLLNAINIETWRALEEDANLSVWSEPVLLYEVIFLAIEGFVYVGLAILLDIGSTKPSVVSAWQKMIRVVTFQWLCTSKDRGFDITTALPDDEDVLAEQDRVLSGEANNDLIVMSQLTKVYDNGKVAVNSLSLGIPPGECFGLLGINGAGKTTTMQMLTAEFPPTSGDATLAGYSVRFQPEKTRRRIGYCPQFDAHFANLTGREHVELYASVKGVPKKFVKEAAAAKLKEVGLSDADSDRLSAGYSGGMRRRLSLACATIGQPQILFLDECSTGVDPVARREIWQLISDMVAGHNVPYDERTSVILTTHSMEECEALCPRIAIMANGRLRCLGSAQHLKSKFGQGYQVELKVRLVTDQDSDFMDVSRALGGRGSADGDGDEEAPVVTENVVFNLDQALSALQSLTGDTFLSSKVSMNDPVGYPVYKDATSPVGVTLLALASFATIELRMRNVANFLQKLYPSHVLRERQDTKVRYEIASAGVRISSIFANIEGNKDVLCLSDYGVSQTSLEQVFNMHAAEAERLKLGRNDR